MKSHAAVEITFCGGLAFDFNIWRHADMPASQEMLVEPVS